MTADQEVRSVRRTGPLAYRPTAVMILTILAAAGAASVNGAAQVPGVKPAGPCSTAHYSDFAFWVGRWNVFDVEDGKQVAHAKVDSMLNDCLVREQYEGVEGGRGISLNSWNAQRHVWMQHWVSDKGAVASIEGNLDGDAMVLIGTYDTLEAHYQLKGLWKRDGKNVRETAWRSQDGGITWTQWFDLRFVRQSSAR